MIFIFQTTKIIFYAQRFWHILKEFQGKTQFSLLLGQRMACFCYGVKSVGRWIWLVCALRLHHFQIRSQKYRVTRNKNVTKHAPIVKWTLLKNSNQFIDFMQTFWSVKIGHILHVILRSITTCTRASKKCNVLLQQVQWHSHFKTRLFRRILWLYKLSSKCIHLRMAINCNHK